MIAGGGKNKSWQSLSLSTLKILFHLLLAPVVAFEKSLISLIIISLWATYTPLLLLLRSSIYFQFLIIFLWCCLVQFYFIFLRTHFLPLKINFFHRFWKVLSIFLFGYFFFTHSLNILFLKFLLVIYLPSFYPPCLLILFLCFLSLYVSVLHLGQFFIIYQFQNFHFSYV